MFPDWLSLNELINLIKIEMATINDQGIILTMLANGGHYCDDPVPARIYSYHSSLAGKKTYSVMYRDVLLEASNFVQHPTLLMLKGKLTEAGQQEIDALKTEGVVPAKEEDDDGDEIEPTPDPVQYTPAEDAHIDQRSE